MMPKPLAAALLLAALVVAAAANAGTGEPLGTCMGEPVTIALDGADTITGTSGDDVINAGDGRP